jgi:slime mold repeat-containing protein
VSELLTGAAGSCDDGVFCTVNDRCVGGVCIADPNPCDDGDVCTIDLCNNRTDMCTNVAVVCDDGLFCTTDSCHTTNGCVYTDRDCSDTDPCTDDVRLMLHLSGLIASCIRSAALV